MNCILKLWLPPFLSLTLSTCYPPTHILNFSLVYQPKCSRETLVLNSHNWIHFHPTLYSLSLLFSSSSIIFESYESVSMVWGDNLYSYSSLHSFSPPTAPLSLFLSSYFIIFDSSESISMVWRRISSSPPLYCFHPPLYPYPCSSISLLFHLDHWHQY